MAGGPPKTLYARSFAGMIHRQIAVLVMHSVGVATGASSDGAAVVVIGEQVLRERCCRTRATSK